MSELLTYILSHEESFRRARLPSLYSDFSVQRNTNPDGYASNISAWQRALANAALAGYLPSSSTREPYHSAIPARRGNESRSDLLVLRTSDALTSELETREWGRPVALKSVIDEAISTNTMIPLQTFQNSSTSPFRKQWVPMFPVPSLWQVMNWGVGHLRDLVGDRDNDEVGKLQMRSLVLVDNVKEAAKRILTTVSNQHGSNIDRIYSKEMFTEEFVNIFAAKSGLSDTDIDILLTFLSRDQNAIIYDGSTIKFKSSSDKSISITPEDRTIASLKTLIGNLKMQVANLDARTNELTIATQNAINNKNRILALSKLRSKKLVERNLKQRSDTLIELEEVYTKIEQAADQVDIVRVMEASTSVLRALNRQVGGVEKVVDVVEELREEMAKVDEVGNVITEAGPVIDEEELDVELLAMESQERLAREAREAELTRRRLAELGSLEGVRIKPSPEAARSQSITEMLPHVNSNADLEASIKRLSQMSIEGSPKNIDSETTESQQVAAE